MPAVNNNLVYLIFSAVTADFEKWALQISTISKIHWTRTDSQHYWALCVLCESSFDSHPCFRDEKTGTKRQFWLILLLVSCKTLFSVHSRGVLHFDQVICVVCFNFHNIFGFSDHILVDFDITVKEQ